MPTHNCATCSTRGHCPLEPYADWLNEHESEVAAHVIEVAEDMNETIMAAVMSKPALLGSLSDIGMLTAFALILSYAKTHATQTPIPDYLLKSFEKED